MKHHAKDPGVGVTTIYELKKQKVTLLKFYAESDDGSQLKKLRKHFMKLKSQSCIKRVDLSMLQCTRATEWWVDHETNEDLSR
jgi:hypothetical protein